MIRQLTIQLRKRQLIDIYGNPIYYAGANPLALTAVIGSIDTTWYDFTDYVQGLQDIELEWAADKLDFQDVEAGEFAATKSATGILSFEREAYNFIKAHLVTDVAAPLNQIEVQITDVNCGRYTGYVIKSTQLNWCEFNALCTYDLSLKQIEDYTNCIERTVISDNWQGWFQAEPVDVHTGIPKKHPRFGYCIEKRPNWSLVLQWYLCVGFGLFLSILYTAIYPLLLAIWLIKLVISGIVTAINFIITTINSTIVAAINALISIVGGTPIPDLPLIPDYDPGPEPETPVEVFLSWSNVMIEAAGCGREHPAPLIRDYILNVCNKCGVRVDASTADVFFAPLIQLTHSDNELYTEPNPNYNACYLHATVKRGVRRYRKINVFTGESDLDTTTYYQQQNAPPLSLDMFLNELNKLFNVRWRIQVDSSGTPWLWIKRKDYWRNTAPLYDFSIGGADRSKIVEGICYQPQEIRLPAYLGYLYEDDPADKCGIEAGDFYNGQQHVTFNFTTVNPIFKGELEKRSGFSPAKFNCDGTTGYYIYDALQVCYSLSTISAVAVFVVPILSALLDKIQRYANYKLLLQTETMTLPKVLIWDGDTDNPSDPVYINATAIRDKINIDGTVYTIGKSGYSGTVAGITVPDVNTLYPFEIPDTGGTTLVPSSIPFPTTWISEHFPNTQVIGQFPPFGTPVGEYAVTSIIGTTIVSTPAILVNFPMYFEPHYKETLWDRYHYIDDPYRNPKLNKNWKLKIPLCCEDVDKLALTGSVNAQKLVSTVLLDVEYYNLGVITSIKVVYATGDGEDNTGTGQYIEISGFV